MDRYKMEELERNYLSEARKMDELSQTYDYARHDVKIHTERIIDTLLAYTKDTQSDIRYDLNHIAHINEDYSREMNRLAWELEEQQSEKKKIFWEEMDRLERELRRKREQEEML